MSRLIQSCGDVCRGGFVASCFISGEKSAMKDIYYLPIHFVLQRSVKLIYYLPIHWSWWIRVLFLMSEGYVAKFIMGQNRMFGLVCISVTPPNCHIISGVMFELGSNLNVTLISVISSLWSWHLVTWFFFFPIRK